MLNMFNFMFLVFISKNKFDIYYPIYIYLLKVILIFLFLIIIILN